MRLPDSGFLGAYQPRQLGPKRRGEVQAGKVTEDLTVVNQQL